MSTHYKPTSHENMVKAFFADTPFISKRHSGAALGANTFGEKYVPGKLESGLKS